jgi:hypothetical protein
MNRRQLLCLLLGVLFLAPVGFSQQKAAKKTTTVSGSAIQIVVEKDGTIQIKYKHQHMSRGNKDYLVLVNNSGKPVTFAFETGRFKKDCVQVKPGDRQELTLVSEPVMGICKFCDSQDGCCNPTSLTKDLDGGDITIDP